MVFHFSSLQKIPGLRHAITTREGGVSRGEFSSLNLAFHVGDDPNDVIENRNRLASELNYDASTLVACRQVHGARSQIVTREYSGLGAFDGESALPDCDALVTCEKRLPLLIQVADCAPILIVDSVNRVLAVVHAGWRGAAGCIASKTIEEMQAAFGCQSKNLRVGIGPCLCAKCFEIGEEVESQVSSHCIARNANWQKPHLNLRALIREDLERAGVLATRIEIINHCPRCAGKNRGEIFFSHRGQNGKAGRFGLVAWWA